MPAWRIRAMAELSLAAAFLAGIAGFASPCVLPLIPSYLTYLGGIATKDAGSAGRAIFPNTLAFVIGLVLSITLLGAILGALLAQITGEMVLLASRISGGAAIAFGFYILGFVRLGFFESRHGLVLPQGASIPSSFALGALFGFVWTPVMGAFLAFVVALAVSSPPDAPALLFSYACGLGLPFLAAGAFASQASSFIKAHGKEAAVFNKAMGLMVIIIGFLLLIGGLPGI